MIGILFLLDSTAPTVGSGEALIIVLIGIFVSPLLTIVGFLISLLQKPPLSYFTWTCMVLSAIPAVVVVMTRGTQ